MMKNVTVQKKDLVDAARAGARQNLAHARYSTEVKLAFGRRADDDRIVHVSNVSRGRTCGCFCPACSEELIAKQGDVMAWHFAHASGGSCKDALSASFAAWMAQELNDGASLLLPDVSFVYGGQQHVAPGPKTATVFTHSFPTQEAAGKPFEICAQTQTSLGVASLRIILKTVERASLPKIDDLRKSNTAGLVIDLRADLKSLSLQEEEITLDEAWLRQALFESASREWIWAPKRDRALEKMRANRLAGAYAELGKTDSARPNIVKAQEEIAVSGLSQALMLDWVIPGEIGLRQPPEVWRALFLYDKLISPVQGKDNPLMLKHIGFSNKEIGGWLRAHNLDPFSYKIARSLSDADWRELRLMRGCIPAFDVVNIYVEKLWEDGYLAAKPWRKTKFGKGPVDPMMAGKDMPFWRPSDETVWSVRHAL